MTRSTIPRRHQPRPTPSRTRLQARRQPGTVAAKPGFGYFHDRRQLRKACLIAVPVTSILWCPLIWFIFRML